MCPPAKPPVRPALVGGLFLIFAGCASSSWRPSVSSLSVNATPATVGVGGAVTLQAIAHLSTGATQDVTSSAQWTLSNTALATFGDGILTSKAPGTLTVQAAYVIAATGRSAQAAGSPAQTLNASAQINITTHSTSAMTPSITWSPPRPILYGSALGADSLDATANVAGSFAYTPPVGTVLKAGTSTLTATFTPSDTNTYTLGIATVPISVTPASPVITWASLLAIPQGTPLSAAQLNAVANVPGTFSYTPVAGTVLPLGTQTLTATFTPSDATDYTPVTAQNSLTIDAPNTGKSVPFVTWQVPPRIQYGAALSSVQLDATASVPGSFAYTPPAGSVLKAGAQILTAAFTPADTIAYASATATVTLMVTQAIPVITWAPLAPISQGTALSATQLDALANLPGNFTYVPPAGTFASPGTQPLTATFTPSDAIDYTSATAHNSITVNAVGTGKSIPSITWPTPAAIQYGLALSGVQLDATASVPGSFAYTPPAGAVLNADTQALTAVFTPADATTYTSAAAMVQLTVNQAIPVITWPPLAAITQGTALSPTQLDATANLPGSFVYSPGVGTVPAAGTVQLAATFTPTDTNNYAVSSAQNSLVVNSASNLGPPCGARIRIGTTSSQIQSAINSCPEGAIQTFPAGSYTITSPLTIPCGVTVQGPPVEWPGPYTAYLNTLALRGTPAFKLTSGCSPVTATIQYFEIDAQQPTPDGGAAIYAPPGGGVGVTIQYNNIHGNWASTYYSSRGDTLIFFDGSPQTSTTTSVWSNLTIQWNQFGGTKSGTGDCASLNGLFGSRSDPDYQGGKFDSTGGYCAALGMHSSFSNLTFQNNRCGPQEQCMKFFEGSGQGAGGPQYWESGTNNIQFNDFYGTHRIVVETQQTPNSNINFNQNDVHDQIQPGYGSWMFSLPAYHGIAGMTGHACCFNNNATGNVFVINVNPANSTGDGHSSHYMPGTIEFWGNGQANYNLVQGYGAAGIQFGFGSSPWQVNNNLIELIGSNNYLSNEENIHSSYFPQMIHNVTSNNAVAALTSVAPSISPAPGAYPSGTVITFTNGAGATNRDTNTGIWVTTDGSDPTPGSGTAVYYSSGQTLTFTGTINVKAVGMWGAKNQPTSYPSGYGYVPSRVVTASYVLAPSSSVVREAGATLQSSAGRMSIAAAPPAVAGDNTAAPAELRSIAIVPSEAEVVVGSILQLKAIATFSDGSDKDVTTALNWTSSDTRTITVSSSGLVLGLATGRAIVTGAYHGHQSSAAAISNIGNVNWSGPIVITEAGTYSGNWQSNDSKTPAVTVATAGPVVIEGSHVSSMGDLIKTSVAGGDLTIRNSICFALNSEVKGQANGVFLEVLSPVRLDVENNYFENAGGGVLVHGYSGNRDGRQTIVIRGNRARNLNGRLSDGNNGYLPGVGSNRSLARFIELDEVQAVPGIDVAWNEVINYPGHSLVADNINVRRSSGTLNRPLEIHDNYIQGAYPQKASEVDYVGGGIKIEGSPDDGAQLAPAFNEIHDNQVVGTVHYGIAFTAGHDNVAANNRVISSGMLADGTRFAAQNVGMENGDGKNAAAATSRYNNSMHDNLIGWACWSSSCAQSGYRKDESFPLSPGDYSANTVLTIRPITLAIENDEYQVWLNKTSSADMAIGPKF